MIHRRKSPRPRPDPPRSRRTTPHWRTSLARPGDRTRFGAPTQPAFRGLGSAKPPDCYNGRQRNPVRSGPAGNGPDTEFLTLLSNPVENTIRPLALNRKNALFAGHDEGAAAWARIASLIETAKMNGLDPHAYLKATLEAIAAGHPAAQIDQLLPWAFTPPSH